MRCFIIAMCVALFFLAGCSTPEPLVVLGDHEAWFMNGVHLTEAEIHSIESVFAKGRTATRTIEGTPDFLLYVNEESQDENAISVYLREGMILPTHYTFGWTERMKGKEVSVILLNRKLIQDFEAIAGRINRRMEMKSSDFF